MLDLNLNYMLKAVNLEAKSALNERSKARKFTVKKRNKNNKGEANDFIKLC